MSKNSRIVLGAASLLPSIYLILFVGFILYNVFLVEKPSANLIPVVYALLKVHVIMIFWTFALLAFYLISLKRNSFLSRDQKIMWIILFIVAGLISLPIYWYIHIWRQNETSPQPRAASA